MMTHLYLSRIPLNLNSPRVSQDLGNAQAMHCRIMSLFPDGFAKQAREALDVLYRPEIDLTTESAVVLIQSSVQPDWRGLTALPGIPYLLAGGPPASKPIAHLLEAIQPTQMLRFFLRANPTRRVPSNHVDDKLAGRRVNLWKEKDREGWIRRKLEDGGCELPVCTIRGEQTQRGAREGMRLSHGAVVFDGIIQVKDPDALRVAIRAGIGSGKAYGFGLLSVAPARE